VSSDRAASAPRAPAQRSAPGAAVGMCPVLFFVSPLPCCLIPGGGGVASQSVALHERAGARKDECAAHLKLHEAEEAWSPAARSHSRHSMAPRIPASSIAELSTQLNSGMRHAGERGDTSQ
jgi:hypothetical protein